MDVMPGRDDAAAAELFTRVYPQLAGWARSLVLDDETAHQIASEAFIRLLSRWGRTKEPERWLHETVRELVRAYQCRPSGTGWRRLARVTSPGLPGMGDQSGDRRPPVPVRTHGRMASAKRVHQARHRLRRELRAALALLGQDPPA